MSLYVGDGADPGTAAIMVSAFYFRFAPHAIQRGTRSQILGVRKGHTTGGAVGGRAFLVLRDAVTTKDVLTGLENRWLQRDVHADDTGQIWRHASRLDRNGRRRRHDCLEDYAIGRLRQRLGLEGHGRSAAQ